MISPVMATSGDRFTRTLLSVATMLFALSGVSTAQSAWFQHAAARKSAQTAFQAEMSREGKDCQNTRTTIEINQCMGSTLKETQANLKIFYDSIKELLTGDGSDLSSANALESSQQAWAAYEKSACNAVGQLFVGGSIRPSAVLGCEVLLTRNRMKELNQLYDLPLRH